MPHREIQRRLVVLCNFTAQFDLSAQFELCVSVVVKSEGECSRGENKIGIEKERVLIKKFAPVAALRDLDRCRTRTAGAEQIPIAGLNRRDRSSWLKLGELWLVALVLNIVGGLVIALLLTTHGVLRHGADKPVLELGNHLTAYSTLTALASAVVAGALMTLMTWFVEGAAESMGVRIVMSWIVGALIALGRFNHAIVSTIEVAFGMRYGASASVGDLLSNLGLAVAGNLVGGLLLVTFARSAQALAASP